MTDRVTRFEIIYIAIACIVIILSAVFIKTNYVELNTGLPTKAIEELKKMLGY